MWEKMKNRKPKVRFRFPPEIINYIEHKTGIAIGRVNYEKCSISFECRWRRVAAARHALTAFSVYVFIELDWMYQFTWSGAAMAKHVWILENWHVFLSHTPESWHSHTSPLACKQNPVWKLMNHRKLRRAWGSRFWVDRSMSNPQPKTPLGKRWASNKVDWLSFVDMRTVAWRSN